MSNTLTALASKLRLWSATARLVPAIKGRKLLAVFTFHRITANPHDPRFLARYDRGASGETFVAQLRAICELYDVITLRRFQELIGGASISTHSSLLTFDDADSEFYSVVFPILKELSLPAVVFTPVRFVDSGEVFWHLRVTNAFNHMTPEQFESAKGELQFLATSGNDRLLSMRLKDQESRRLACQRTIWMLDRLDEQAAISAADKLEQFVGCDYTLGIRCMNWEQLGEIESKNVSVESHTMNHPKLTRIPDADVLDELKSSKDLLDTRLQKSVSAICYPGGYHSDAIHEAATMAGYSTGFTTEQGFCSPRSREFSALAIPRFDMRGSNLPLAERFLAGLTLRF